MKYKTIDELDARIERIISRKVKHYYTDWKNYDRPAYMKYKGSNDRRDKTLILIARDCGTYLLRQTDIDNSDKEDRKHVTAYTIYEYYNGNGGSSDNEYYKIDIDALTISRII